jgi:hypothetical protein
VGLPNSIVRDVLRSPSPHKACPHYAVEPFIHAFPLQQNFATYKGLISLRLENGCKKNPFYNMIPTFSVTY